MKRQIQKFAVIMTVLLFPNLILAQNSTDGKQKVKQENVIAPKDNQKGNNFIDKNNNGVCDRFENKKPAGKGPNFTDADKNGICDHCENGTIGTGKGWGYQHRHGQRKGQCCGRGPCGGKGWKNR